MKPKFVTPSPVNYIIGSGPLNIHWDNTWIGDSGCNVLLQKFVANESTSSGSVTNLGFTLPQTYPASMSSLPIETADESLHLVEHKLTLIQLAANMQCVVLEVTVVPAKCELDRI